MKSLQLLSLGLLLTLAGAERSTPASAVAPTPVAPEIPTLAWTRQGSGLQLTFGGILQSAETLAGPWLDVTNAASPFTPAPGRDRQFYRARSLAVPGIFDTASIVAFSVTGPLQHHFNLAFAGTPDGIFPPKREKPYFDASLRLNGRDLPVSLRVRGNSSLQECPFPKLKFKVSREDRVGTPFEEAREVKLGTHCADGGTGNVGRLRDEIAAAREALAYETMDTLGFVTPRVRRALVDYHDTTPAAEGEDTGWVITRHAVLLEDIEVLAARLGAQVVPEEEVGGLTSGNFDEQLVTDLLLFHALIGNWDYSLATGDRNIWNTDVLEFPDGKKLLVAGDFDLASWVTGIARSNAPRDYHPELADVERETLYQVEQIQRLAKPATFAAGKERFLAHRSAIESRVATSAVDEPGRTNAVRHVVAFYGALATTTGR